MSVPGARQGSERAVLLASTTRTVSGNSGALEGYGPYGRMVVQLNVTAASGTTPSMTVTLEDTVDGTNYNPVQVFTAKTTTGIEVFRIPSTTPFSDTLRLSWALSGTTPSFTFTVSAFFQAL